MPIDQADTAAIDTIINVNFKAPVLFTSGFIRLTQKYPIEKKILNITSGAASIPHHGMSMYCSTKAALDMFSLSVSKEQNQQANPVEIHAISPGFLNTDMPNALLQKNKSAFAAVDDFTLAKENGKFADPGKVVSQIIKLWQKGKLEHGKVSHLSDY
jgi:benzil reductase ((S)-benzoin forming)